MHERRAIQRVLVASFLLYIVFGLPDGVLGTVWPNLRDHFGRSDGSLGAVILATAVGYGLGSVVSGPTTERVEFGDLVTAAMGATVVVLLALGGAPAWWVVVAAYGLLGLCWGVVDAAVNAWMALTQGPREMGLLHAFYGVGAFLGPLLATAFVADGTAWRGPFVVCAVLTAAVVANLGRNRAGFGRAPTTPAIAELPEDPRDTRRVLVLMIIWFSVYVGVEVAVGSWSFTLLTEGRGYSDIAAGALTAAYWGGLTAGRFGLAIVGHRIDPEDTVRRSIAAAAGAVAILWIDPLGAGGLALPVIGLCFASMFPLVMGRTAIYVGERQATRAVGYQVGATGVGFTALPALIGILADRHGIEITAPVVLASVVVLGIVWLAIERDARPVSPAAS